MADFGAKFVAKPRAVLKAAATPPSGQSPEAIWQQWYDTQTYTGAALQQLQFFNTVQADKTRGNMEIGGQFASPKIFEIHNLCCDIFPVTGTAGVTVSGANTGAGEMDDMIRTLLIARPTWTLTISDKTYGPYSLTLLHGTGGPRGVIASSLTAPQLASYAVNNDSGGWNYYGRIIIPEQVAFQFNVQFGPVQTLAASQEIRISMLGVLSRRVV